MTRRGGFITNRDGNTLLAALRAAVPAAPASAPGFAEVPPVLAEIAIATGFISPAGFAALAPQLEQAGRIRLLLGAEPEPEAWRAARRPGDAPAGAHERRAVAAALRRLDEGLRRERDRQAFSPEARAHLRAITALLRTGRLETRRYETGFLQAKAMLLDGFLPTIIVGSSNLTQAGLGDRLELNLATQDDHAFRQARDWFDLLWDAAVPFDLAAIFAEAEAEYPPWLIFLRILWQLYGPEIDQETRDVGEIGLTEFQKHGVWRARRILREHGGVIIADEVGLGKTFIAGELLAATARNKQSALLVCPAALRDTTWRRFFRDHDMSRRVETVSFDQLASDRQFHHPERRPHATRAVLDRAIEDYALVVVDEAHNYRNPDSPYRADVLRRLLSGERKQVALLTATPVNNSLWDLYHLMLYFLKHDGALAGQGIVHIRERFRAAAAQDPSSLNPDLLYPVIDAITVKRTRAFVKKHYAGDTIRGADGVLRPIVFPRAVAITLRYDLEQAAPGLFDAVADALDPEHGRNVVAFARYAPEGFLREGADAEAAEGTAGLLRSGLLKRFESSAEAFRLSLARMVREHDLFLSALDRGKVATTGFLRELALDEEAFDALVAAGGAAHDAADYDVPALRAAVARDRTVLHGLAARLAAAPTGEDPKLLAVVEALAEIAAHARADAATDAQEQRNRKVLVFSYFADTVAWLRHALAARIATDPRLAMFRDRIAAIAGAGLAGEEVGRAEAVWGFAPESSDPPPGQADLFDLLITTDVLAEGMNLQQCRNIINYDLPWNPMRLVQRHGRIDRIGSRHPRVFLRSVFPADRLDALLALEARILRKLTQAARSIGVATSPVERAPPGSQVFAETRAEIERLASGDAALFEHGGEALTGEEYRQRLRAALAAGRDAIVGLPGGAGSGMRRGRRTGVLFCAEVALAEGPRSFLRFVPSAPGWQPATEAPIERELGTCLRLIDCTEATPRHLPTALGDAVFAFWQHARTDILAEWDNLSDPAALQPRLRPLNRELAGFLRAHPPPGMATTRLAHALDVLEAPWPRREEALLRDAARDRGGTPGERSRRLVEHILATGLDRFTPPAPLPPIATEDVRLVCWMALEAAGG